MEDTKYFVRSRGKITGPFDIEALTKLARRKMVTAVDELSSDRVSWSRAGEYDDLFPQRNTPVANTSPSPARVDHDSLDFAVPSTPAATAPASSLYFYQQRGATIGPVSDDVLRALVKNGTLSQNDLVWIEGDKAAYHAGQMPLLMALFPHPRSTDDAASAGATQDRPLENLTDTQVANARRSVSRSNLSQLIAGIVLASLTLLAVHLPWSIVEGHPIGWWTAFTTSSPNESDATALLTSVVIYTMATVAILIVLPLLKGYPRAIVCLSIGAVGAVFYAFMTFLVPSASAIIVLFLCFYLIPVSTSGIGTIVRARGLVYGGSHGKPLLGVFSGIAGAAALTMVILIIPVLIKAGQFAGLFVGSILLFLALLVVLASSALGLASLKPVYSSGLNLATYICSRTGSGLVVLALFIMGLDVSGWAALGTVLLRTEHSFVDMKIEAMLLLTRMIVLLMFFPAIFALGLEALANQFIVTSDLADSRTS